MIDNQSQKFVPRVRDFEVEKIKYEHKFQATGENPLIKLNESSLKKVNKEEKMIKKAKKVLYDPLSQLVREVNKEKKKADPKPAEISTPVKQITPEQKKDASATKVSHLNHSLIFTDTYSISDNINDNWAILKQNLINLFCNNSDMIVKSLISVGMDDDDLQQNYKIDKGRTRLDELEKEGKGEYSVTTSGEYVSKLETLKREMLQKWEVEDKVGAIKIMIHCTKILNDVSTPKFYCHKFLIIMDILETFSNLVFERIFKLAFPGQTIKDDTLISPSLVKNVAKEICSNWIYKCSCIRELLPRIYIDIIFLKIYKFLKTDVEIESTILSIARKIAGISHPLISFYLSTFFVKIVSSLYPKNNGYILFLMELLSKYKFDASLIKKFGYENINIDEFTMVVEPCYEWMIYSLSRNVSNVRSYYF